MEGYVKIHVIILVQVHIKGCAPLVQINVKEGVIRRVKEQVNVLCDQLLARVVAMELAMARVNPQQKIVIHQNLIGNCKLSRI